MKKKNITVLGSSGTIGKNTLDVVRKNKDKFNVYALSANQNIKVLSMQIKEFKPKVVVLSDELSFQKAKKLFSNKVKVLFGDEGLMQIASEKKVDFVMAGIVGAAGLKPFIAALESNKMIGLANKEVLVMAGEYFSKKYPNFRNNIIPVDSEHSAIYQCLQGRVKNEIEDIILTASGGPFLHRKNLNEISVKDALKHPNWNMGAKISIDSATMMNKGFEVMEAYWLFDIHLDKIKVVIHPQSIIHSMVSFTDGAILAHLGIADMRIPIQFALHFPSRGKNNLPRLDFFKLKQLTFEKTNVKKFPCLDLAYKALKKGGLAPAILNASNEIAVKYFLNKKIKFTDITKCNAYVLKKNIKRKKLNLENIINADYFARLEATKWICNH